MSEKQKNEFAMARLMLKNELWSKLRTIMHQHGIYDKPNLWSTVEAILFRICTGIPWRDLPAVFGNWNSIYQTFNRWSHKGKWMNIFKCLIKEPDLEWEFIDSSTVKAHQHSTGARGSEDQAIGKSVGGNTTKIHMVTESYGLPIEFKLSGGQVHDCKMAPQLIESLPSAQYTVADRGYNDEEFRLLIRQKSSIPVIPRRSNSIIGNDDIDWSLYKNRHLVENLFARIKHFRAIATRYDKLARNYASVIAIVCSYLWLPM